MPSPRRAAASFEALTKLPLSKRSLSRLVTEYGRQVVAHQATEAAARVTAPAKAEGLVWRDRPQPDSEDRLPATKVGSVYLIMPEDFQAFRPPVPRGRGVSGSNQRKCMISPRRRMRREDELGESQ